MFELPSDLRKQNGVMELQRVIRQAGVELVQRGEDGPPFDLGVALHMQVSARGDARGNANQGDPPCVRVGAAGCMFALRRNHDVKGSIHCFRSQRDGGSMR